VLDDNGHQVMMWGPRGDMIDQSNELHDNKEYVPEVELSSSNIGTADGSEALNGAEFIIVAEPTKAIGEVQKKALPYSPKQSIFVHASKG
ncbi:glycerol-3-phosphate dehydrogenase, partial [Bacillus amyloliquefaciens]|nr:glycerol-3-phosphate dehydrogenase [Bacillus amyloliquefaciens]